MAFSQFVPKCIALLVFAPGEAMENLLSIEPLIKMMAGEWGRKQVQVMETCVGQQTKMLGFGWDLWCPCISFFPWVVWLVET